MLPNPSTVLAALPNYVRLNPRQKSVGANVLSVVVGGPALIYAGFSYAPSWKEKLLLVGAGGLLLWANSEAIKSAWGSSGQESP